MIFISSPYSHASEVVRKQRYDAVLKYTAQQLQSGFIAFSPIVYGHPIAEAHALPTDWNFWNSLCIGFLKNCTEMHVLMLEGWEESTGIRKEIKIALLLKLRISYIEMH